jgi:hypothetical protein
VVGDDRVVDPAGLEPFRRLAVASEDRPRHGVMVAVRGERLQERTTAAPAAPLAGTTRATALTAAGSYWYTARFRASLNYTFSHFIGTHPFLATLPTRQLNEVILRVALAL